MKYSVVRTDTFEKHLIDILIYLSQTYSKKVANDYLDYLESQLKVLEDFPYMWPYDQRKQFSNHRILISDKNIVFYKIDETKKQVICEIITSSDENYLNLK